MGDRQESSSSAASVCAEALHSECFSVSALFVAVIHIRGTSLVCGFRLEKLLQLR